jgi:alkylation response protein AidB-like acyl-CoA dehydrogenase
MGEPHTPETELFLTTARAFLDKHASLQRVRSLHADDLSFDPAWWIRAAELGWTSLLVPEELGGGSVSGDGLHDLALIAENLGHTVAPGPLHPVSVVLAGLAEAGNRDQHAGTIESLMSGATVGAWAVDEPGRPFSPQRPAVTATPTADGYRINGVKDRVEAGAESALLLVVARGQDGPRQFLVPTDAPGLTLVPQRSLDLVKRYARVDFSDVTVTAAAAVGSAAQTPALIDRQAQVAVVLQCAELVGILDTVLGMTMRWALDRHSFGRPLASYQALKHRLADMKMWLEACRGITYGAVADVAARKPDAQLTVSAAKSYLGEHATTLTQECVQLHGGIGVTWEHDLHLFLRRITLYRSMFGTPAEHHRAIYARLRSERPVA